MHHLPYAGSGGSPDARRAEAISDYRAFGVSVRSTEREGDTLERFSSQQGVTRLNKVFLT